MIFSLPTIPLTKKATELYAVKQESNDLYIPINFLIILFILDLFQE